jgi:predicted transcriptional regulator
MITLDVIPASKGSQTDTMKPEKRRVTIHLDERTDVGLDRIAQESDRSRSAIVRDLVRDLVRQTISPDGERAAQAVRA